MATRWLAILVALVGTAGCREGERPRPSAAAPAAATAAAPSPPAAELDLRPAGLDARLSAPAGAAAHRDLDAVEVGSADGSFWLEIRAGAADLPAQRRELADNDLNRLKRVAVDEPGTLVYEGEVAGRTEFHFVAVTELGGAPYTCRDAKGRRFTAVDVERMLAACRSLQPLPPFDAGLSAVATGAPVADALAPAPAPDAPASDVPTATTAPAAVAPPPASPPGQAAGQGRTL
jgi:hypothetical protein